MGFFNMFRRALGLNDEIDSEESILADAAPPAQPRDINGVTPVAGAAADAVQSSDDISEPTVEACPDEIFATVVDLFDSSLPPFIADNLDREAQRRHIHALLDESMKQYLAELSAVSRERVMRMFDEERSRMQAELDELRRANKSVKESGDNCRQQQLSAERQKRALNERVKDLEKQIAALNADREQLDLENKSLANRLRLMAVREEDAAESETVAPAHGACVEDAADKSDDRRPVAPSTAEADDEVNALQAETVALRGELEETARKLAGAEAEIVARRHSLERLQRERQQLQTAYDELKSKQEMSDVMINDLNSKASDAMRSLAEAHKQLEAAGADAGELQLLRRQCENLQAANESLKTEIERGRAALELLAEAQQRIEVFEKAVERREVRIAELTQSNADKDERIAELTRQIEELPQTGVSADSQAETESSPQVSACDGTDRICSKTEPAESTAKTSDNLDRVLDDTDWLVSTPPPGTDARTPGVPDSEFGYQEPKRRKPVPENPAQMLLFDPD